MLVRANASAYRPENPADKDLRIMRIIMPAILTVTYSSMPRMPRTRGAPPTIIFHGEADTTVPFRTAQHFTDAMSEAGNRCTLVGYESQTHGFFNYGRGSNTYYVNTVRAMDEFLRDVGAKTRPFQSREYRVSHCKSCGYR
jgi:acetyl esterase/lipase